MNFNFFRTLINCYDLKGEYVKSRSWPVQRKHLVKARRIAALGLIPAQVFSLLQRISLNPARHVQGASFEM